VLVHGQSPACPTVFLVSCSPHVGYWLVVFDLWLVGVFHPGLSEYVDVWFVTECCGFIDLADGAVDTS
jgi:hypothetical protein